MYACTHRLFVCAAVALVALLPLAAKAVTISSAPFSLGYGWTGATWNTSETAGANTATTIGDFTFLPTFAGIGSSGSGPQFPLRVLTDGVPALTSASAEADGFLVTLAGAYSGTLPGNAEQVQITINVDSISTYVVHRSVFGNPNPGYAETETTPGHLATSPVLGGIASAAGSGGELSEEIRYSQIVWDPTDYATPGVSFIRTFENDTTLGVQYAIDGFEITGTIDVTYIAVPEPATLLLATLGAGMLCVHANRRRQRAGR